MRSKKASTVIDSDDTHTEMNYNKNYEISFYFCIHMRWLSGYNVWDYAEATIHAYDSHDIQHSNSCSN